MSNFDVSGYVDVAERIRLFAEKHPNGCLRPAYPSEPYKVEHIGESTFIVYVAAAYRSPEDDRPGIGVAWEAFPGRTNFTRDSELQNAETSAWGRAIVAVLAADTKRGIASSQEVQARNGNNAPPDRKRELREQLLALGLPNNGTLEELEARLASASPPTPLGSGAERGDAAPPSPEAAASPQPLPPATEEKKVASGPCVLCMATNTKRVLGAGRKTLCADSKGCKERQEMNAESEAPFTEATP